MRKLLWLGYSLIVILIALVSFVIALATSSMQVITTPFFTTIYLVGLYGYVYEKAIWNPRVWRFLFWLLLVGTLGSLVAILLAPSVKAAIRGILVIIGVSFPLLLSLFKYSKNDNSIWINSVIGKKTALLEKLLEKSSPIMASVINETESGLTKTNVSIEKLNVDTYQVKIAKHVADQVTNFSNEFNDLWSLARFIEENTPIRINDFASQLNTPMGG